MLKTMSMPVPSPAEQEMIVKIIKAQREKTAKLVAKQQALQTLKTALLQDLLTGKVRVGTLAATLSTSV